RVGGAGRQAAADVGRAVTDVGGDRHRVAPAQAAVAGGAGDHLGARGGRGGLRLAPRGGRADVVLRLVAAAGGEELVRVGERAVRVDHRLRVLGGLVRPGDDDRVAPG